MTFRKPLSALSLLLVLAPAAVALESDRQQELVIEADQLEGDEQARVTRLSGDVFLRQGTLNIRADRAELHGSVEALERLVVEGEPAILNQELEAREGTLHAEARRIDYDLSARRLILSGNAMVDQANRQLTGERILYDLDEDRVVGESDRQTDGERVRIRIDPQDETENGN